MRLPLSPRRVWALLGKEMHALFAQPLLWIVGTVFLVLAGYYFYTDLAFYVTFGFGENIFENFFQLLFVDLRLVLMLTIPLLTMRLFAEEKKLGTIELLFTYPLTDLEIFVAKLIACTLAAWVLLAATGVTLVYLHGLEAFPVAPVLAGYAGLALMAVSFVAIGILLSSLTDNQVVAAMSTAGTLLLLWVLSWSDTSGEGSVARWFGRLSMFEHFEGFTRGVIETKDLVYFGSLVALASAAALQVLGSRSWRGRRLAPSLIGLLGLLVSLWFVDALAERHNVRFDLTPQKRFTLSAHARRILEQLPRDVELVAFLRSGDPRNSGTLDLLQRIAEVSPRVGLRAVDVNRNPAMARRYGVDAYGAIVVESGGRRHVFNSAREDLLVGAMLELTRATPQVIVFRGVGVEDAEGATAVDGGGRLAGFRAIARALVDDGATVRAIGSGDPIPPDTSVLVVVGQGDVWTPGDVTDLDAFVRRGGRVLALLDPLSAPALVAWLGEIGIAPRGDVILDPDKRIHGGEGVSIEAGPPDGLAAVSGDAGTAGPISASLDHGVLLSLARSLDVGDGVVVLLTSGDGSWATPDVDRAQRGLASFDGSRDRRGPHPVAVAREWQAGPGRQPARVVVVGDSDVASDAFLDFLGNRDFVQNAISWLAGDEDLIALRPRRKEFGTQQFFLSAAQARTALLIGVVAVPGASALLAFALWARRRFKR